MPALSVRDAIARRERLFPERRSSVTTGVLTLMSSPDSPALSGLAPWIGGKRNLARRLVARIAATPHTCYAEPFIGMGGVFLRRPVRAKSEVINDWSRDVANLFRVLQRHTDALMRELEWRLASRDEFARLAATDPDTLTDIERAARFLYLQYNAFGGSPRSVSFRRATTGSTNWNLGRVEPHLRAVARRLAGVHIERLPYADFIRDWDRPSTLFYCDPPYWGCEDYYGKNLFVRADFERLATTLRGIKGHFIMSINDVPEIRAMFAWARIEEEDILYTCGGKKHVTELVISGGGA
jgi:DNA adenine methylase